MGLRKNFWGFYVDYLKTSWGLRWDSERKNLVGWDYMRNRWVLQKAKLVSPGFFSDIGTKKNKKCFKCFYFNTEETFKRYYMF